jgi:hypothetical protein
MKFCIEKDSIALMCIIVYIMRGKLEISHDLICVCIKKKKNQIFRERELKIKRKREKMKKKKKRRGKIKERDESGENRFLR